MLSVPSLRLNQFGVRFYEALLSGADLQSLVGLRGPLLRPGQRRRRAASTRPTAGRVNWEFLEKKIAASEQAFQRPIIKKKIDELVAYYLQCADSGTLPAIPGSVLLVSEQRLEFSPSGGRADSGLPEAPRGVGHPAGPRRPAPPARPPPARREAQPEGLPGSGRRLRQPDPGPGRRALRHDQQQAHEAEPLAPDLALRPPPLPRRQPGRRPRRHPDAQRGRRLAAAGVDQGPRHRQGLASPRPRSPTSCATSSRPSTPPAAGSPGSSGRTPGASS